MSKRTITNHWQTVTKAQVRIVKDDLERAFTWLENGIADVRRDIERGGHISTPSFARLGSDADMAVTKLRAAYEALGMLSQIESEDSEARE